MSYNLGPVSNGLGYINGCNVEGTNATQTFAVAAGVCRDSTNVRTFVTAGLTGNMAVVGANGIDAGVAVAGVWHVFVISTAAGALACLASLSSSAPTLPGGYVYFRRVGSVRHNGVNLSGTIQYGKTSERQTVFGPTLSQNNTSTGNFTFDWSTYVPATAHYMDAQLEFYSSAGSSYANTGAMNFSPWVCRLEIDNSGYPIARNNQCTIPLLIGGSRVASFTRVSTANTMGVNMYCYGYREAV